MVAFSPENFKKTLFALSPDLNRVKGRFGIEIEIEGQGVTFEAPGWTRHAEGSLRGEGVEYVLTQPASREAAVKKVGMLRKMIQERGGEVFPSYRGSVHVHMNMLEETFQNILNIIAVFTLVDPLMTVVVGDTRHGNLFCLNSHDTGDLAYAVLYNTVIVNSNNAPAFYRRGKYASLNMDPLSRFGSLEVRIFPSSVNPDDHDKWLSWLENVISVARSIGSDKDLRAYIDVIKSNPTKLVADIFKGAELPLNVQEAHHLIGVGVENAYEVYRAIKYGKTKDAYIELFGG